MKTGAIAIRGLIKSYRFSNLGFSIGSLCVNRSFLIRTGIVIFSAFFGPITGFLVSPDLAGYPMIATEEQLQKIRLEEIKEYLLVGGFIRAFSGLASIIIKSNKLAPYSSVCIVVAVYLAFEGYRVEGEIFLLQLLKFEYLSFFISGFIACGSFQVAKYYHLRKNT